MGVDEAVVLPLTSCSLQRHYAASVFRSLGGNKLNFPSVCKSQNSEAAGHAVRAMSHRK